MTPVADADETYEDTRARVDRLQNRADEMHLSSSELETLISYFAGGAPDVLERALDYIARKRSDQHGTDTAS